MSWLSPLPCRFRDQICQAVRLGGKCLIKALLFCFYSLNLYFWWHMQETRFSAPTPVVTVAALVWNESQWWKLVHPLCLQNPALTRCTHCWAQEVFSRISSCFQTPRILPQKCHYLEEHIGTGEELLAEWQQPFYWVFRDWSNFTQSNTLITSCSMWHL